jgi:hypothetical protein
MKRTLARPNPKKDKKARRKARPGWKEVKTAGEVVSVRVFIPVDARTLVVRERKLLKNKVNTAS